jgi:DNA mismatch repair protein MSH5
MKRENADHVNRLKQLLSGFVNVSAVFRRIMINNGNVNDWKAFKRTVFNIYSICELSWSLTPENVQGTLLHELGSYTRDFSVNGILFALDKIVDLEEMEEKKRFIVKKGVDEDLDAKRDTLNETLETFNRTNLDEALTRLNTNLSSFQFTHFPELGFVVGTSLCMNMLNLSDIAADDIELILQTDEAIFFRTPNTKKLNEDYDKLMVEIVDHELSIFKRLFQYINLNFAELSEITKICAKLDCLIGFAGVSTKYNYVRPIISTTRQLKIVNGRHPLIEQFKTYIPSTTDISEENGYFINIIRAPNSSGKSVYVKQVAIICYMVHIGCFVPCESCTISLLESIYTRIYAQESIFNNESAFMSDLQQMSKVVMYSTNRSLLLIDEFGKGTQYKDGIALLTATIEHFSERGILSPFVFVTTHNQEVYDLLKTKDLICTKSIKTKKNESDIYESTFEIVDESDDTMMQCYTEYPESKKILNNIFKTTERDIELQKFNESYNTCIKAFSLICCKMMLRKQRVSQEFLKEIYTKLDIDNFLA